MKNNLFEALDKIRNSYDAFYFENKYGTCTHEKEFQLLADNLKDDKISISAINWIRNCYDCYYKDEYLYESINNPFGYLKNKIEELENSK